MIGVTDPDSALGLIDEKGIKYVRLWFTDVLGVLRGMTITRSEIEMYSPTARDSTGPRSKDSSESRNRTSWLIRTSRHSPSFPGR